MGGADSLQTLAEVSVALAGFGSLLVVLRRDPNKSWAEGEALDLFVVVGGNLLVLFFSLLPLPMFYFGLSEAAVWRPSSMAFGLVLALAYWAVLERRRQLLRAGASPAFPRLSRALTQLPLVLVAILALNAAGILGGGVGAYLLVLVLLLTASSSPLLSLVVLLGTGADRDDGPPSEGPPAQRSSQRAGEANDRSRDQ